MGVVLSAMDVVNSVFSVRRETQRKGRDMSIRIWSLSLVVILGSGVAARAQSGFFNPSNPEPQQERQGSEADSPESATNADDDEPPPVYEYPQRHMFEQPVFVGQDHLRHHTGYWQPGGYQTRDGSPFFNSVPGAPPRGPIAGGGGDSSYNPTQGAGMYGQPAFPGFGGQGAGLPLLGGMQPFQPMFGTQFGMQGHGQGQGQGQMGGNWQGGGMAGGSGGPGGDPYNYHFGPGYYRSGEYGHFRFPYYSYRRPWFFPGFPGFNRDVNLPW